MPINNLNLEAQGWLDALGINQDTWVNAQTVDAREKLAKQAWRETNRNQHSDKNGGQSDPSYDADNLKQIKEKLCRLAVEPTFRFNNATDIPPTYAELFEDQCVRGVNNEAELRNSWKSFYYNATLSAADGPLPFLGRILNTLEYDRFVFVINALMIESIGISSKPHLMLNQLTDEAKCRVALIALFVVTKEHFSVVNLICELDPMPRRVVFSEVCLKNMTLEWLYLLYDVLTEDEFKLACENLEFQTHLIKHGWFTTLFEKSLISTDSEKRQMLFNLFKKRIGCLPYPMTSIFLTREHLTSCEFETLLTKLNKEDANEKITMSYIQYLLTNISDVEKREIVFVVFKDRILKLNDSKNLVTLKDILTLPEFKLFCEARAKDNSMTLNQLEFLLSNSSTEQRQTIFDSIKEVWIEKQRITVDTLKPLIEAFSVEQCKILMQKAILKLPKVTIGKAYCSFFGKLENLLKHIDKDIDSEKCRIVCEALKSCLGESIVVEKSINNAVLFSELNEQSRLNAYEVLKENVFDVVNANDSQNCKCLLVNLLGKPWQEKEFDNSKINQAFNAFKQAIAAFVVKTGYLNSVRQYERYITPDVAHDFYECLKQQLLDNGLPANIVYKELLNYYLPKINSVEKYQAACKNLPADQVLLLDQKLKAHLLSQYSTQLGLKAWTKGCFSLFYPRINWQYGKNTSGKADALLAELVKRASDRPGGTSSLTLNNTG